MNRKLPPEAFSFYLGLGHSRSYAAVAEHFGVSKRSVTSLASRERWQEKLKISEIQSRAKAEERAQESLEEMTARQLKMMQVAQRKLLEGLRVAPTASSAQAIRALVLTIEKERQLRGAPAESDEMTPTEYAARCREAVEAMERATVERLPAAAEAPRSGEVHLRDGPPQKLELPQQVVYLGDESRSIRVAFPGLPCKHKRSNRR